LNKEEDGLKKNINQLEKKLSELKKEREGY
jgi:predicted  nucleic acid-binding Zn-ribbon protein